MFYQGYKQTKEHTSKINTPQRAKKISQTLKRLYKEGKRVNWNEGKKLSEEHKKRISQSCRGRVLTLEQRLKLSKSLKNRFKNKRNHPKFGTHLSEETKRKISIANTKENPTYGAIHSWIKRFKKKPNFCELCGEKRKLELANKDHLYKRKIEDYLYLCRSCHRYYDIDNNNYFSNRNIQGCWWWEKRKKWVAYMTIRRKRKTIGYYKTKKEAIKARENYKKLCKK